MNTEITPSSTEDDIPIFVISLSDAKLRRKHITAELKNAGLAFTFLDAVNGKELPPKELEAVCDMQAVNKNPQWLSPGAIGCALSHLNIYQTIVKEQYPWTLILEDDVVLTDNFREHLKSILQHTSTEEVIMLYFQSWEPLLLNKPGAVKYLNEFAIYPPVDIAQVITTGAYLISLHAAEKMAKNILPIQVSADSWGWYFNRGVIKDLRCVYPRIVETAPFKSSIDYFTSSSLGKVFKIIDKFRIPLFYQFLKRRRRINFKKRQLVELTDKNPQWLKN